MIPKISITPGQIPDPPSPCEILEAIHAAVIGNKTNLIMYPFVLVPRPPSEKIEKGSGNT